MPLWPFSKKDGTRGESAPPPANAAAPRAQPAAPAAGDPLARLIQQLTDGNAETRARAIAELGDRREDTGVLPALIACLKHRHNDVKKAAAEALGNLRDRHAVRALVVAMIGIREPIDALEAIDPEWRKSAEAAEALGDLRDELKATDHMRRRAILDVVATIGTDPAVEILIEHLWTPDGRTAAAAAAGLTSIGDRRAVLPLATMLKHKAPEARAAAVTSLMAFGDRSALRDFNTLVVSDPDAKVRRAIAEALGEIADQSSYEALAAASLGDKDPMVLQAAKAAFAKIPKRSRAKS
jgi:HEAT repeat protein